MIKFIFNIAVFSLLSFSVYAQETREELEKQRAQLKREMDQTQKLLIGHIKPNTKKKQDQ